MSVRKKAPAFKNKNAKLKLVSYEITDEPIYDNTIPNEILEEMEELFEKAQQSPESVVGRLEVLIDKYPKVPKLYNYISAAYSRLGNNTKSKYYAEKNYQNNPDYLFAKLNYAEICMMEKTYEKIPEIFNNKFDIKELYPERDVFHISEVIGFMGMAGSYFAITGNREQAELFYNILRKLAPDHHYTKRIKKYIANDTLIERLVRWTGRIKKQ